RLEQLTDRVTDLGHAASVTRVYLPSDGDGHHVRAASTQSPPHNRSRTHMRHEEHNSGASGAGGMPAFASQLDLLALLLAVFAAVLPPLAASGDQTRAGRMRALLGSLRHFAPPSGGSYGRLSAWSALGCAPMT